MAQSMKSCVYGRDTQLIHVQLYKPLKHITFIVIMVIAVIFIFIAIIIITMKMICFRDSYSCTCMS